MKIFSIVLVALVCLPILASAVPDSVTTGPYLTKFDMGEAKTNYTLAANAPKETETLGGAKYTGYSININDKTNMSVFPRFITIDLVRYEREIKPVTSDDVVTILTRENKYSDIAKRVIDGSDGVVASIEVTLSASGVENYDLEGTIFNAIYYPASDQTHLRCTITSTYPWDEGTLQFLKTVHIEKIEESAIDSKITEESTILTALPSKILIEANYDQTVTTDNPLKLAEGYVLQINHIDVDGNNVYLDLLKNDKVVDSKIVSPSKDNPTEEDKIYRYKKDIGNSKNVTLIEIHFKNAFRGSDQDLATVSSVIQISEKPIDP